MTRLLLLAAPHLRSLALIVSSPFQSTALISRLFRTSFPNMIDLTISGFYPFPSSAGKFPKLKSLHLNGNTNPVGLFQTNCLTKSCPSLRSLYISGLQVAGPFAMELHEALKGRDNVENERDVDTHDLPPVELPKSIQRIVVQAGIPGDGVTPSAALARLKHKVMMERLGEVESSSIPNVGGVLFAVRKSGDVGPSDIYRSWIENIG
ncbi:hypothetical protein CVT24_010802 [Panaeolus cyanescens]|uniref:Uncharacterized protein n=1 Tax=Panaeolus cyanescens TaxID=181874 RepID=A0A409VH02_9AGAR|nr:hypothetical protein CVT24_010802 [Panaeolus cyanescens]